MSRVHFDGVAPQLGRVEEAMVISDEGSDVDLQRTRSSRRAERRELVVAGAFVTIVDRHLLVAAGEQRVECFGREGVGHEDVDVDHHPRGGVGKPVRQQPVRALERERVDSRDGECVKHGNRLRTQVGDTRHVLFS